MAFILKLSLKMSDYPQTKIQIILFSNLDKSSNIEDIALQHVGGYWDTGNWNVARLLPAVASRRQSPEKS